jgi:hypothetical protein
MWLQRCVLGAACLACVIAVADRGAGAGDNGKAKHDATLSGREYYVQLTLYETDKNGLRKVFGNSTISTPEGEEFNYLSGGEFPVLVDQQVDWAQFGVSAHGKVRRLSGDRLNVDASIEIRQKKIDPADDTATTIVGQSVRTIRKVKLDELVHITLEGETPRFLDLRVTQDSGSRTVKERQTSDSDKQLPAR